MRAPLWGLVPLSPHYRIGRHPTPSKNPQLRWSVAQRQLFPLNLRFASVFCRVETIESGRYWGPGAFNELITHNNACGTLFSLDILLIGVYWQCSGHGWWWSHCTGYQVLCRWHCSNCSMFCSVTNDSWAAVLGAAVLTRDIIICCSSWITSCCRHCYTADPAHCRPRPHCYHRSSIAKWIPSSEAARCLTNHDDPRCCLETISMSRGVVTADPGLLQQRILQC